jgi:carbamoylphosphate synthase large subunit
LFLALCGSERIALGFIAGRAYASEAALQGFYDYLLDELKNDITCETPASFEPSIDYVVTKIPRFAFEKFPQADPPRSPRR